MYTGTLIGMLIANALYADIVTRMSRRRFIPIVYRFAVANLFVFFLLMRWMPAAQERTILAPIFFIWVSVFNLFATTMFWSFMADVFTPEQAKRLFGFIAVGGSIGGIVGGLVTSSLAGKLSTGLFLLITAVMLEIAAQCVRRFPVHFTPVGETAASLGRHRRPLQCRNRQRSNQLAANSGKALRNCSISLLTWSSGVSHDLHAHEYVGIFSTSDLTGHQLQDRAARTSFLANIDIAVNTITVLIQVFLTARLMKWFGVGVTLVLMPLLSAIGFAAIGVAPFSPSLRRFRFCDGPQASPYFDQRAKFSSPCCGEKTNTKPRA